MQVVTVTIHDVAYSISYSETEEGWIVTRLSDGARELCVYDSPADAKAMLKYKHAKCVWEPAESTEAKEQ